MVADFESTFGKIKTRGYWRINFYPVTPNPLLIKKVTDGKEIVRNASVELRGWDYPHFPTQSQDHQGIYVVEDRVEAWIDWERYKEIWRMYQSGQFIHFFGLREDWFDEDNWIPDDHPYKKISPGAILEVISTIYSITEIYLFLRNLTGSGLYRSDVTVEISLKNTKGRDLHILDPIRAPLFMEYKRRSEDVNLPKKTYTKDSIINNYLELALEATIYLFQQFNWDNPPIEVIKEDQKKLLERRI